MSHRRVIILDSVRDDSDEDVPEPSFFLPSFVSSFSDFRSQVEASAAKKRAAASEEEKEEDSIAESSESKEATTSAPSAAKKQRVADRQQEQAVESLSDQSEHESSLSQEQATTNGVSAAKELNVATREEEQEEESSSEQSKQERSASSQEATASAVSAAEELKVAAREEEQDKESLLEQKSSPSSEEATTKAKVPSRDKEQEEESLAHKNEEERSTSEAGRFLLLASAVLDAKESNTPSRNEEQQKDALPEPVEQERSPLFEVATTSAVLDDNESNTPPRDEEQQKDALPEPIEQELSPSLEVATTSTVLDDKESNSPSRDEGQEEDAWPEPSEQERSPSSEVASTSTVLDDKESNTPSHNEEQQKDARPEPSEQERSPSLEVATTSAVLDDKESNTPSRDEGQEEDAWPESSEQERSPSSEAAATGEVLAAMRSNTPFRDEEHEMSSKRRAMAKRHFEDADIEDDEDQQEPNTCRDSMSQPPSPEIMAPPTFPEIIHMMITETAATQPDLIEWVHNGRAFVVHDPKSNKLADVLEEYFNHRKYSSLQRQLNMYGWKKSTKGKFVGAFYNELFHRDRGSPADLERIRRRAPPRPNTDAAKRSHPSEKSARLNGVSDEDKKQPARPSASPALRSKDTPSEDEVVSTHVQLEVIPKTVPRLDRLTSSELDELELALQFDPNEPDDGWQNDWSGHVALLSREVTNPLSRSKPGKTELRQPLWEWALTSSQNLRFARNLLRHVYYANGTPPTARRILAHAYHQSMRNPSYELETAMKRVAYDPAVLREDGWTTAKTDSPIGVTGGPYHIGLRVLWEKWEAVVIAYIHDSDIGDLWKALWLDGNDTFDLEAEELQLARQRWERKFKPSEQLKPQEQSSARFAAAAKFTVEGIEHGIVMAKTYNPQARKGLYWPARIMHVSELDGTQSQSKRSSTKQKLHVIFLAPYWNITIASTPKLALADSLSQGKSTFSSGPLFEVDTLDASEETIQKYPYEGKKGLNLDQLRVAFRFTGLPKNVFSRFLDSHRLALALKTYAQEELKPVSTHSHAASAALTDTHAMAIETAKYPSSLLHLPFEYILSHLPRTTEKDSLSLGKNEDHVEPTIKLQHIMQSMEPPACWGKESGSRASGITMATPVNGQRLTPALSGALATPVSKRSLDLEDSGKDRMTSYSGKDRMTSLPVAKMHDIASDYLINAFSKLSSSTSLSSKLLDQLAYLLSRLRQDVAAAKSLSFSERRKKLLLFLMACLRTKGQGEDTICSEEFPVGISAKTLLMEWRKACENVFKHASIQFSCSKFGNSVTFVITDSRCNEHITSNGCVERPVRLPAALKGARQAGVGAGENVEFLLSVGDEYMTLAEQKVIGQAHSSVYLKRMRLKCAAIAPGIRGVPLTDDSNNEGGEDTRGSRGSYTAAVAGVAAAIKGVDMILGGQCVNAFCATRPPGHHAGRELHPMKAISNGFCILNTAACAALYATTPLSEHGPGLKRICVIDFDVHHGNGTQDILCQTYDPRFLYISLHAGGAHINGYESEDSDPEYRTSVGGSQRKEDGIFPGRCGDTSPHKGVLNIPLGARVTAQNVGNALVSLVGPAVFSFSPDLIIVSAGFDAHKNDPLGMGGLSAEDFGHITDVICSMAYKSCSGRVLSVMEGGYGVPCCRPQKDLFLPLPVCDSDDDEAAASGSQQPLKLLDLDGLPDAMDDQVPAGMQKKLDRCHAEGFVDCVREHVGSLAECNDRSKS